MPSVSHPVPVRHGKCRLLISINEHTYKVKRLKSAIHGGKIWKLTKADGSSHVVSQCQGWICCTCPDHGHRAARCKHIGALVAVGLASKRAKLTSRTIASLAVEPKGDA